MCMPLTSQYGGTFWPCLPIHTSLLWPKLIFMELDDAWKHPGLLIVALGVVYCHVWGMIPIRGMWVTRMTRIDSDFSIFVVVSILPLVLLPTRPTCCIPINQPFCQRFRCGQTVSGCPRIFATRNFEHCAVVDVEVPQDWNPRCITTNETERSELSRKAFVRFVFVHVWMWELLCGSSWSVSYTKYDNAIPALL